MGRDEVNFPFPWMSSRFGVQSRPGLPCCPQAPEGEPEGVVGVSGRPDPAEGGESGAGRGGVRRPPPPTPGGLGAPGTLSSRLGAEGRSGGDWEGRGRDPPRRGAVAARAVATVPCAPRTRAGFGLGPDWGCWTRGPRFWTGPGPGGLLDGGAGGLDWARAGGCWDQMVGVWDLDWDRTGGAGRGGRGFGLGLGPDWGCWTMGPGFWTGPGLGGAGAGGGGLSPSEGGGGCQWGAGTGPGRGASHDPGQECVRGRRGAPHGSAPSPRGVGRRYAAPGSCLPRPTPAPRPAPPARLPRPPAHRTALHIRVRGGRTGAGR